MNLRAVVFQDYSFQDDRRAHGYCLKIGDRVLGYAYQVRCGEWHGFLSEPASIRQYDEQAPTVALLVERFEERKPIKGRWTRTSENDS